MKITWFGHAAFGLEANGARILTDPYSFQIGFAPIDEAFDLVTFSHQNPKYHSCLDEVLGEPEIVDGLELARSGQVLERSGVRFGAVEVAEDEAGNGPNAMVWIESDGLRVLHMGDCGHEPSAEQVEACGQVDVLLALAGAGPTLSLDALLDFVQVLQPKLVLPMHFGAPQLKTMTLLPIEDLAEAFAARFGVEQVQNAPSSSVEVSARDLLLSPTLLIVPSAR